MHGTLEMALKASAAVTAEEDTGPERPSLRVTRSPLLSVAHGLGWPLLVYITALPVWMLPWDHLRFEFENEIHKVRCFSYIGFSFSNSKLT